MLFIHNDVVAQLLTMRECIEAQEHAFRQIPGGGAIQRPRIDVYVPCEREDGYYRWGTMEGTNDGILAIRMKSDVITWPVGADGYWRENKYCVKPGTFFGLILLLSARNGEPLAFINDGVLQHMRVGGGAGIGAKHLARKDASTVGILGSGGMAHTYLEAFVAVRPIKRAKVFSPTPTNRNRFAAEMSAKLGIAVEAVDTAREAVRGVDILATCTDSMAPTFPAAWLEEGTHVTMAGPREQLAVIFHQTVVVENRTGGSGAAAMAALMNQPADGYNILSTTSSMSFTMATGRIPFAPGNFTVLPALQPEPSAVAVRADSRFRTLRELVEHLRDHPGQLSIGGFSSAGFHQFVFYRLQQVAGFKSDWIPFKGGQEAGLALLGGHIDAAVITPSSALAQIESSDIRLLGISSKRRSEYFADVPAFKEQGFDVVETIWRGVMVKAGTPQSVIDALTSAIAKVTRTAEWKEFSRINLQSSVDISLADLVIDEVASDRALSRKTTVS